MKPATSFPSYDPKFLSEQTDLTWTDTEKIGHYLNRLRENTEKLARQNNQLASYHKQVSYHYLCEATLLLLRTHNKYFFLLFIAGIIRFFYSVTTYSHPKFYLFVVYHDKRINNGKL